MLEALQLGQQGGQGPMLETPGFLRAAAPAAMVNAALLKVSLDESRHLLTVLRWIDQPQLVLSPLVWPAAGVSCIASCM